MRESGGREFFIKKWKRALFHLACIQSVNALFSKLDCEFLMTSFFFILFLSSVMQTKKILFFQFSSSVLRRDQPS